MVVGEVIAAVATPPGTGAVAMVRVSGCGAIEVADRATGGVAGETAERRARLVRVTAADGRVIDDCMLTVFRGPRSYTGEDLVELTCHGGMLVTRQLLERLLECGARPAEPGEFTQRAFLNGKLDLTQAEAVMDLIAARTEMALRAARAQLEGRLAERAAAMRADLLEIVARLEAWIDFPEEAIDPETGGALAAKMAAVRLAALELLGTAEQGRILREGVRTVIYGEPNVGKSSLLNGLAGHARVIVSETPGTTRDTVEEMVNAGGIVLRLTDTAGIRESACGIEREGVRRSERALDVAELVLEVADASLPPGRLLDHGRLTGRRHVLVLNKCDLGEHAGWSGSAGARVSCRTGAGIEALQRRIAEAMGMGDADWGGDSVAINARHQSCLRCAVAALAAAEEMLGAGEAPEFVAVELREALDQVGQIAGKVDVEEILGEIFSRFCIGK